MREAGRKVAHVVRVTGLRRPTIYRVLRQCDGWRYGAIQFSAVAKVEITECKTYVKLVNNRERMEMTFLL